MHAATPGPSPLPPLIAEALRRQITLLTPNQRVARGLRHAFDAAQRQPSWSPPTILPIDTWLASLWHQLLLSGVEKRILLNRTQEHALWRNLIAADFGRASPTLHPLDTLADLAVRAWHLLHLHLGSLRHPEFGVSTDTRTFQRWALQFERLCTRSLYITSAQLPAALELALTRDQLNLPTPGFALIDFDLHPPAHDALLAAIGRAGTPTTELKTAVSTLSATLHPHPDQSSELLAAALWARDQLQLNPSTNLALVVPDLASLRPQLERSLSAVLPESAFEFSLGQPLAHTVLAASALGLLRWTLEPLPLPRIADLLLSPFLTSPAELADAAEFDAYTLRQLPLLRPELTLEAILPLLSRQPRLSHLHARLQSLKQAASPSQTRSHAVQAEHFRSLLEAASWPLLSDSLTFQARLRWESALDELATLDLVDSTPAAPAATLETFTRILRQMIFAPESRNASLQVLGPLELGGRPFDALYFLSADDRTWSATSTPHPLLPHTLQRALGMPGTDTIRDASLAQALTKRIAHSAPTVLFSYPQRVDDAELRPSFLLRSLGLTVLAQASTPLLVPLQYVLIEDSIPLPSLPHGPIRGGERILKDQAACPFRAFAEHRLWSAPMPTHAPGLDPRDRGSLVHHILQAFWSEVQTQAALSDMPPLLRAALLDDCIVHVLTKSARAIRSPWDAAYLDLECRRLNTLLLPWLTLELDRPPFTVLQQEHALKDQILGPLRLDLRVDRIDQTAAGLLILDYKTGGATPSQWLSGRPEAPQLPLYAVLTQTESLAGIAFALVRPGKEIRLQGFTDHPNAVLTGKQTRSMTLTLQAQREEWHRVLLKLAEAFAEGDTRVDPKSYPKTCTFCTQRTLCRLDPTSLNPLSIDEEDHEPAAID